ncbi:hypothetical protein [Methylobacter sp. YRD-M1]|uniref:hypothetical protein n=1 Tax=Methylobacter sp. YRD-M1 TaxID=2911520 RepID=UPI00227B20F5|nr:hypothetical protein [Methylobacter sp. YRD-M1]WAK01352.1 hypothetical protein LZ558_16185 [Methylobacter sp. YRD-M1]
MRWNDIGEEKMSDESNNQWMYKSIFDKWKYRHESATKLSFQWSFVIIALLSLPLVRPEVIDRLGSAILLLPEFASYVALIAFCQLRNESEKINILYEAYSENHPKRLLDRFEYSNSKSFINYLSHAVTNYLPYVIAIRSIWCAHMEHLALNEALSVSIPRIWSTYVWYVFIPVFLAVIGGINL